MCVETLFFLCGGCLGGGVRFRFGFRLGGQFNGNFCFFFSLAAELLAIRFGAGGFLFFPIEQALIGVRFGVVRIDRERLLNVLKGLR